MVKAIQRSSKKVSRKHRDQLEGSFQLSARRRRIYTPKASGHGSAVCPGCGAVYFDKHWHTCSEPACRLKAANSPKVLCEECRLTAKDPGGKASEYSGVVVIEGVADPAELAEIKSLALNVAARAAKRDPEDRVIKVLESAGRLEIQVSENQLAVSIGKQVHQARKGGELSITWSKEDKPVRVRWTARS